MLSIHHIHALLTLIILIGTSKSLTYLQSDIQTLTGSLQIIPPHNSNNNPIKQPKD